MADEEAVRMGMGQKAAVETAGRGTGAGRRIGGAARDFVLVCAGGGGGGQRPVPWVGFSPPVLC
jgi:hypothetical protein